MYCTCVLHYITSVKIIKNEEGCRDDTVPKTVETRRHCWIESMQQSSTTPKNRDVGRGLWKIVAYSQSTSQCLLHPSSCLMIFTLHFSQQCIGIGNDTVGKQRKSYTQPPEVCYTEEDQRERALCAVRPQAPPGARRAR